MSNKRRTRDPKRGKLTGPPGGQLGVDATGHAHRILTPGGFQPGAVAGPAIKRGLNGDYQGTCIGCMRPTDTGLVIIGPAEAQLGFLMALGCTWVEAVATAKIGWKEEGIWDDPDYAPPGELQDGYRLCAGCAPEGMEVREVHSGLNAYRVADPGETA